MMKYEVWTGWPGPERSEGRVRERSDRTRSRSKTIRICLLFRTRSMASLNIRRSQVRSGEQVRAILERLLAPCALRRPALAALRAGPPLHPSSFLLLTSYFLLLTSYFLLHLITSNSTVRFRARQTKAKCFSQSSGNILYCSLPILSHRPPPNDRSTLTVRMRRFV